MTREEKLAKNAAYAKEWRLKHPGYYKEYKRKLYRDNREAILARLSAYKAVNPDRVRSLNNKRSKEYRARLGDKYRLYTTARTRAIKAEMIAAYGGKCVCCNETTFEFLSLDHINGRWENGIKDRRAGNMLYYQLRKAGWPQENYRLLCMNCNTAFGFYGYCPHQPEVQN